MITFEQTLEWLFLGLMEDKLYAISVIEVTLKKENSADINKKRNMAQDRTLGYTTVTTGEGQSFRYL